MAKVSLTKQNVHKTPRLSPGWHRVSLNYNPWTTYFQELQGQENKHNTVTAWLRANVRKGHWIYKGYYGGSIFDFKRQSDAVQFSLLWGG